MEFDQIKQRLKQNNCSLAIIAKVLNKSHTSVTSVAKGNMTSKHIATAIAKACGLPIKKVFPDNISYQIEDQFSSAEEKEAYWHDKLAS